jgi:hypothetical protein
MGSCGPNRKSVKKELFPVLSKLKIALSIKKGQNKKFIFSAL